MTSVLVLRFENAIIDLPLFLNKLHPEENKILDKPR